MRAIVEISGKQYPIQEGRYVLIDSYDAPEAAAVTIDKVQLIIAGEHSLIGAPYVDGASVKATVKRHGRGNKILVYKMRCKKGYRRKNGHRQGFTELQIESLDFPGKDKIVALLPKEEPPAPKKERAPKVEAAVVEKPAKAPKAPKAEAAVAPKAAQAPKATEAATETKPAAEPKPKKAAAPKAKAEGASEKPAKSTSTAKKTTKKATEEAPAEGSSPEAPAADVVDNGAE